MSLYNISAALARICVMKVTSHDGSGKIQLHLGQWTRRNVLLPPNPDNQPMK
jgi:hypothetical protein